MADPDRSRSGRLGSALLGLIAGVRSRTGGAGAPWHAVPGAKVLLGLLVVSSVSGTGLIVTLNMAANAAQSGSPSLSLALAFVVLIVLYKRSQTNLSIVAADAVEHALDAARLRISRKLLNISLRSFETLSHGSMSATLVQHCQSISTAVLPLTIGLQSVVLLALTVVYLFVMSVASGLVTLLVGAAIVYVFLQHRQALESSMAETAAQNRELLDLANGLVAGFKELRLHRTKRDAVLADLGETSTRVAEAQAESATHHTNLATVATSVAYLLGAAAVFLLPVFGPADETAPRVILTTVLFMIGPLGGTVGAVQQLATVRFAYREILGLEATLDGVAQPQAQISDWPAFQELRLQDVRYTHEATNDTVFQIGPLDLVLATGKVVFITGGNGSGKTTALRLVCGLYQAESGQVFVNGQPIERNEAEEYRQMFGPVFADLYVFNRLYGFDDRQIGALEANLEYLRIRHKLPADLRRGFHAERLSTGERKRLALALAMAENRPILIFDELAADQDPDFRRFFYRDVLPRLRREGHAILAVTHDERYFDAADLRYHMEEGRLSLQSG